MMSDGKMFVNDELGRMWGENIMANFMVISWYLSERMGDKNLAMMTRLLCSSWTQNSPNMKQDAMFGSTGKLIQPNVSVAISSFNNSSHQAGLKSLICYLVYVPAEAAMLSSFRPFK
jgi:hypothetical protein